jgi:hypothetical protein
MANAASAPGKPESHPPAKILYHTLRHRQGLSHEAATRCLREALKSCFRAV